MTEAAIKKSRVDDAYTRIKDEIRSNRMPPGIQGTEPEIALRLAMSRTPVREALIKLEAEGLVELVPRRGVRVLPLQADDMREIYEILTALEPDAAASLALRKPSIEELEPLDSATSEMEAALRLEDLDRWARADDLFHRRLLELHGNRRLMDIVTGLYDQAHRARMLTLRLRELPVRSTEEHRQIVTNIHKGKSDTVRTVFVEHRKRAARELLKILENYNFAQL